MNKYLTAFACLVLLTGIGKADSTATVDAAAEEKIRNSLSVLLPGLEPDTVRQSPVPELFEITFGPRIVYITSDGRYLVQGKLVDLETRTEITDERLSQLKQAALESIGADQMISYSPDKPKHTVSIFTDIDCGFCRQLHAEMEQYNKQGIAVRYLFYPRAGIGSDSYKKAVSVWCADDRQTAMDSAKAGNAVPEKSCENPVEAHYELGQEMRVQGTPAIVLADGEVVPGYVPADKLRRALDQRFPPQGN